MDIQFYYIMSITHAESPVYLTGDKEHLVCVVSMVHYVGEDSHLQAVTVITNHYSQW